MTRPGKRKPDRSAQRAHAKLVARRKAARRGVPRVNPATKKPNREYR